MGLFLLVYNDCRPIIGRMVFGGCVKYGAYVSCEILGNDDWLASGHVFISSQLDSVSCCLESLYMNCMIRDSRLFGGDIQGCVIEDSPIYLYE